MAVSKVQLRRHITDCINFAKSTGDMSDYFNATAKYAVYRALGGTKTAVLPPFCDKFLNTIFNISKSKIKYGNKLETKLDKCVESFNDIDCVSSVDYERQDKCVIISLCILDTTCTEVSVGNCDIGDIFYLVASAISDALGFSDIKNIDNILRILTLNWEGELI